MTRAIETIPLGEAGAGGGTWGSSLLAHPELPVVVMSLPTAGPLMSLVVVDVSTGEVAFGKGLSGDLHDAVFDGDRALLLTSSAICRVTLLPKPTVDATIRPKGLGKDWPRRLFAMQDGLFAISGAGKTTVFTRGDDHSVVKRVGVRHVDLARVIDTDTAELASFHGGEAAVVSLSSLKVLSRRPIPEGTRPCLAGASAFVASGPRGRLRLHPAPPVRDHWRIKPREILELESGSLRPLRRARLKRGVRDVLAVAQSRLVLSTEAGFRILDMTKLAPIADIEMDYRGVGGQCYVPAADVAAAVGDPFRPTQLKIAAGVTR